MAAILDAEARPAFPPARSPGEAYFQHLLSGLLCKDPDGRPLDLAEPAEHFGTLFQSLRPGAAGLAFSVVGRDRARILDCDIAMHAGDLADAEADGIVSSARWDMSMRSGVADALRRRGGDSIEQEAATGGERALGECIATGAGQLKARHVLHAVSAWNETSCVGRAMLRALALADRLGLRSLALPALGTGSAQVSLETCANAMATALRWRLALGGSRLKKVTFVLGDESKLATFRDVALEALRGQEDAPRPIDLGLPDERRAVSVDAATCIDASAALTK
jgi:serine/threonine-protein kinase